MKNMSWGNIYVRRPPIVSVALGLAAIISFAGAISGISAILTLKGPPTLFGTLYTVDPNTQTILIINSQTDGWVMLFWNLCGLLAIYFAQLPRSIARFAVIGFTGVTGIFILSTVETKTTILQVVVTILWAAFMSTPSIMLLTGSANEYYSR
jgi:hypothetical protein